MDLEQPNAYKGVKSKLNYIFIIMLWQLTPPYTYKVCSGSLGAGLDDISKASVCSFTGGCILLPTP